MISRIITAIAITVLAPSALAQQRIPNPGNEAVIRTWPDTGAWGVALVRVVGGRLGCILGTARVNPTANERLSMGFSLATGFARRLFDGC
jgi:hypothetical protein